MAVNLELEQLPRGAPQAVDLLGPGGRLAVISFHSLEDRVVKAFIREQAQGCVCPPESPVCVVDAGRRCAPITPKPVTASEEERRGNPRSRSAKLRVAERLAD